MNIRARLKKKNRLKSKYYFEKKSQNVESYKFGQLAGFCNKKKKKNWLAVDRCKETDGYTLMQ